jgi:hypothetical protein
VTIRLAPRGGHAGLREHAGHAVECVVSRVPPDGPTQEPYPPMERRASSSAGTPSWKLEATAAVHDVVRAFSGRPNECVLASAVLPRRTGWRCGPCVDRRAERGVAWG